MPRNDQEAFAHLTAYPDTSYEINLLTYAMFADEKAKWLDHFFIQNGRDPTLQELESWISNITDQHFEHMRFKAARYFDAAARLYMRDEIEQEKAAMLETAIVKEVTGVVMEVKAAGSFWRQIGMAVLTAVLAPVIIGGILAAFLAYNEVFPTFVRVPVELTQP